MTRGWGSTSKTSRPTQHIHIQNQRRNTTSMDWCKRDRCEGVAELTSINHREQYEMSITRNEQLMMVVVTRRSNRTSWLRRRRNETMPATEQSISMEWSLSKMHANYSIYWCVCVYVLDAWCLCIRCECESARNATTRLVRYMNFVTKVKQEWDKWDNLICTKRKKRKTEMKQNSSDRSLMWREKSKWHTREYPLHLPPCKIGKCYSSNWSFTLNVNAKQQQRKQMK